MRHYSLIAAGAAAGPVVVAATGAVGLNASLAEVGNVLVSAVIPGIGLVGFGLYRKQHRER